MGWLAVEGMLLNREGGGGIKGSTVNLFRVLNAVRRRFHESVQEWKTGSF